MATLAQLRTRLKQVVQDGSFTDALILSLFNEGQSRIAAGIQLPDGSLSPPLPDLLTSANVTATTTASSVAMPADFQRNLFFVYSTLNDDRVCERDNIIPMLKADPAFTESGQIDFYTRRGGTLYYYQRPTSADTLVLRYYKKPTDLSTDASTPSALPEHLHYALLVNYAASTMFDMLERNSEKRKKNFYEVEFIKAMVDLARFVGEPEAEPENVVLDVEDY